MLPDSALVWKTAPVWVKDDSCRRCRMKPFESKTQQTSSLKEGEAGEAAPSLPAEAQSSQQPQPTGGAAKTSGTGSPQRPAPAYFSWQILLCALAIAMVFMVAISTRDMAPAFTIGDSFHDLPESDEGLVALALRMQLARAELQHNNAAVQVSLRLLADFSLHQGNDQNAAKYLQRLLDSPPLPLEDQRMYAAPMLMQIYFDHGQFKEAKKVFENNRKSFFKFRPQMRIYELASRIYQKLGEDENRQAVENVIKGIRLNESGLMPSNPNSPDPIPSMYYSAQSCMAQGEYAQARKLLQILSDENLVAAHPEMPLRVQLMLPVVTGLQGDYEKAAEEFATSVKIWNQAKAWNSLSMSESYAYLNTYADVLRHTGREERADAVQRQADALEKQMQARLPDMLVGPIRWWNTKKESP